VAQPQLIGWIGRTSGTRSDLVAAIFPSCEGSNLLLFLPVSSCIANSNFINCPNTSPPTQIPPRHTVLLLLPTRTPQASPPPPSPPSPPASHHSHVREHPTVTLRLVVRYLPVLYATLRLSRQNWPTVAREHLETRAACLRLALLQLPTDHQLQHSPPPPLLLPKQHTRPRPKNPPSHRRRRLYPTFGTLVRYTTVPACRLVSSKARSRARSCRLVHAED
jgi:hypothetical protein